MNADEMRALAAQVQANHAKLEACDWHEFERIPRPDDNELQARLSGRYRCKHCGGEVDANAYRWHEIGRRPGKVNPEPPKLSIVWHDTPESTHRAMWGPAAIDEGMTYEQLMAESTACGETADGETVELSHEDEINAIRGQGCWAFVDTTAGVIHAWAAPDAPMDRVMHMLAHEIGHATGDPHPDGIQEEMRAEQFGRVAREAYRLLCDRLKLRATCAGGRS